MYQLEPGMCMRMGRLSRNIFKQMRMHDRYPIHDMDVGTKRNNPDISDKDKADNGFYRNFGTK